MLIHILFFGAVVVLAAVFALLEIEIEGSEGWASGLPTWRIENRWTRALLGARAVTGYHLYVHLFVLLMLHLPYALGLAAPGLAAELRLLAFLILFWVVEDFLWFVLNPAYGIHRFTPRHAWWHARSWWWIMPREYWLAVPVGIALYAASHHV